METNTKILKLKFLRFYTWCISYIFFPKHIKQFVFNMLSGLYENEIDYLKHKIRTEKKKYKENKKVSRWY